MASDNNEAVPPADSRKLVAVFKLPEAQALPASFKA